MKKLFAMIIAVVMVTIMSVAFADNGNCDKECEDLENYLKAEGIYEIYSGKVDEWGIFRYVGGMNLHAIMQECNIQEDMNDLDSWFVNWYENTLMEMYPQYGEIGAAMSFEANYNGTDIWHLTIASENDLVDWIENDQCILDALVVFY